MFIPFIQLESTQSVQSKISTCFIFTVIETDNFPTSWPSFPIQTFQYHVPTKRSKTARVQLKDQLQFSKFVPENPNRILPMFTLGGVHPVCQRIKELWSPWVSVCMYVCVFSINKDHGKWFASHCWVWQKEYVYPAFKGKKRKNIRQKWIHIRSFWDVHSVENDDTWRCYMMIFCLLSQAIGHVQGSQEKKNGDVKVWVSQVLPVFSSLGWYLFK